MAGLDDLTVHTIKGLAMDAVQAAQSGHPGMPMGMADLATVLWTEVAKHDPSCPDWPDRDRIVLSNGHGSMLLYSMLFLTGTSLTLDDLKHFRQWGSPTAGHPEYGEAPGIETTTGPLGQGIANAVGMAIADRWLRERFGKELVDHRTWVFCGDGCLMEGISSEATSLAGHLGLDRLTIIYDDNGITIDGKASLSFSEDVSKRFVAMGWHAQVIDGHDRAAIRQALERAKAETSRPSIICARTVIAHGAPNLAGTSKAHGAPLGDVEVRATKEALGSRSGRDVRRPRRGARARAPRESCATRRSARVGGEARGEPRARALRAVPSRSRSLRGRVAGVRDGDEDRDPQGEREGDPVPRATAREPDRRERRPRGVERLVRARRRRPREGRLGQAEPPLRDPRARDGVDLQRAGAARRRRAVLRDLPHVPRLHAASGPARRDHAPPGRLRVHARQRVARRGRTDAPARRAPDGDARDAEPVGRAPGGRERNGRGVEARAHAARRTDRALPHAAEPPGARRHGRRSPARRLRAWRTSPRSTSS